MLLLQGEEMCHLYKRAGLTGEEMCHLYQRAGLTGEEMCHLYQRTGLIYTRYVVLECWPVQRGDVQGSGPNRREDKLHEPGSWSEGRGDFLLLSESLADKN